MKRLFLVLTIAALAVTVVLATLNVQRFDRAKVAAHEGLPDVQSALEETLVAVVNDAADVVRAWQPGEALPDGMQSIEIARGVPDRSSMLELTGTDTSVAISPAWIELITGPDPDGSYRRGKLPTSALRERVLADERRLGAPAGVEGDAIGGRYSVLQLVAVQDERARVLWSIANLPDAEGASVSSAVSSFMGGGGEGTVAQRAIAGGDASDGTAYKDAYGSRTMGAWRPAAGIAALWVVAEIRADAAIATVAGPVVSIFEIEVGRFERWHLSLALAVLALIVTIFLSLQQRETRLTTLLRVFKFVGPYKWGAVSVILLGLLFTGANAIVKISLVKKLVDDVLVSPGEDAIRDLWLIGIAAASLGLFVAVVGYLKQYLQSLFSTAIMADIRLAIGQKIVSLPLAFFNRFRAGDLVARIERDSGSMRRVVDQAFKTAAVEPFELAVMVVLAFVLNWRLALVLLGMPILVYPLFRIARRIKQRSAKRQILLAEISHVIFQMLVGIKVVKAFGGERREAKRLDAANQRFIGQARRIHRLTALSASLLDMLQMFGAAIVMVAGGYFVLAGDVTAGDIMAFILIIQRIYKAAKQLTSTANGFVNALPGIERVFEVLDAPNELVDGPDELRNGPLATGIRFENVSFAYGEKHVLEDINLDIPAGHIVAVVGPTGAGKSTLCDLVGRFYDPTAGTVSYDGVDVRQYTTRSLLANVAIVTQDAFLFNASIEENIRYGKPRASRDEIEQAARDAFVHDEILSMEGAYEKEAGERGSAVSGGQRQRITIARALLKDAAVLVLDEATSALDTHAEKQVQAALDKLMSGRTVIVVAHRLSTIRNADTVVVMRDGRIVEQGPPADLLDREDGQFKKMWELQMGGRRDDSDSDQEGGEENE